MAFALGADMVNAGREAMISIGCIQAQRCHTGHCPSGVATQSKWRQRGIDPVLKAERAGAYVVAMRREITRLARSTGVGHPSQLTPVARRFGIEPQWAVPEPEISA